MEEQTHRRIRTDLELKREFWSKTEQPAVVDMIVEAYPDRPAGFNEAAYILHERILDVISQLPIIGRYVR